MSPQPWPVILPLLVFVAAPARALEPWGLPDFREQDKQGHAAAGFVIGAAGTASAAVIAPRSTWFTRWAIGVAAAAVISAAKEAADSRSAHHDADPKDAIAGVAGGIGGALAINLIWRF